MDDGSGPSRPARWSTIKQRFSQVAPASTPSDEVDDGLWDRNDANFLHEVSASNSSGELAPVDTSPHSMPNRSSPIDVSDDGSPELPTFSAHQLESEPRSAADVANGSIPAPTTVPQHARKHTKNKSSLVLGLRKLMGKRETEHKDLVISAPLPSSFTKPNAGANFLQAPDLVETPAVSPSGSESAPQLMHTASSTPASLHDVSSTQLSAMHRSASADLLGAFDTPSESTRNKHKSIDGLARPFRAFSNRIHSSSSSLVNMQNDRRRSVIEHVSYDEARKANTAVYPADTRDLRSIPSPLRHEFEAMALSDSTEARPLRPDRRPLSSNSYTTSVPEPWPSTNTVQSVDSDWHRKSLGSHTQFHRPFPKEAQRRQPFSQPSSPIYAGFDHRQDSMYTYEPFLKAPEHSHRTRSPGHAARRSLGSSKPWSGLLNYSTASSTASSLSHHKRLSAASISRPLSVSSSTLSEQQDFASDMLEDGARPGVESSLSEPNLSNLIGANFGSSFCTASFRTTPQLRVQTDSTSTARGRSSSMIGGTSGPEPAFLSQDPSMYRSKSSQSRPASNFSRPSGSGHRSTTSVSSLGGHRKRPSFGLAIAPDAHMAFDSIPSPTVRSRREASDAARSASLDLGPGRPHYSSLPPDYAADNAGHSAFTPERQRSSAVPLDEGDSPPQAQENWAPHYAIYSPEEATGSNGRLSQATKDIAFGSAAGMVSKVFEHPFDLVKVRLQTQSGDKPPRYAGAFDCFKQTYLNEGVRGLYRGLSMPVIGATLENACLFFTYNQVQRGIRWWNGQASSKSALKADAEAPLSIAQLAIAAAGAGSVTSFVLTPIELIKCKMQVQMITQAQHPAVPPASVAAPVGGVVAQQARGISSLVDKRKLDGPLTLARRTIAADGLRGLWLGQTGTLLRETGGSTAWFLAFESCSRYLIAQKKAAWNRSDVTKKDLTSLELIGAGALSGISYNVVLFPADSVKSTMQTEQEMMRGARVPGAKFKGTGFFATFNKIYATRGLRGLYAGCGVTCLRSAPSSAIIFLMYNKLEALADSYGL